MSWAEVTLNEICETQYGYTASATDEPIGPKFLRITDIVNSTIDWGSVPYCPINENDLDKYLLRKGDIVIARTGATTGYAKLIRENDTKAVFASYLVRLKLNQEIAYPGFVGRLLESHVYKKFVEGIKGGAAQPNANAKTLTLFKFTLPDISTQERIAENLSTYDDLIKNNKQRIELLEESARQLYKEWFVRFRFPGHEHVKIINGIPEGWVKYKISDVCVVGRGASPRPIQAYMDGDVPWFKIGDATASESPFIFDTKEKVIDAGAKKSVYLPEGELILSNSATCGVPNFTGVSGCIHDGWLYFKDLKIVDKWFLYLYLVFKQKALLQGIGEGATQKNLNTTYVGNQELIVPDAENLLQVFTELVEPLFLQIQRLASYNRQLSKARDLLLPKLMSGEIVA